MGAGGCMFCTRSVEDAPQRIAKTLFSKRWSRIFGCLQDGPTDNKDGIDTCPIPYKVKVSQDCDGWCMPTHSRIKKSVGQLDKCFKAANQNRGTIEGSIWWCSPRTNWTDYGRPIQWRWRCLTKSWKVWKLSSNVQVLKRFALDFYFA